MNAHSDICNAFCDQLSIRKVPIGYAIKTPFSWLQGDPLVVFGEVDGNLVRMRDGGDTLISLEDDAGDLSSESRVKAMRDVALAHGVTFDEDNSLFTSTWVDRSQFGDSAIRFMSFLNRLQDVALLDRDRVANTFREDLIDAITDRFESRFQIDVRGAISSDHPEYTADVIIRSSNMQAAIYAATTEVNVLEALLAEQVFSGLSGHSTKTIPFLVFEDYIQSKVTTKTRRRAMNSARLQTADWAGGAENVIDKIERQIAA
ncbi:DUF1828 domain-containing protein [Puniceibacterium sp. IMCC21224]|uniref:DUF1828 domain-containing protein n=1 Tax=Puniceibacterium sp. IMCC21224 TaxID=1618204 RepID=UPI00065DB4FA|nr:DUF1828 domain-containing protein [Puniceibacterium sp. IMCC21224]KMK68073.1 protein of unknown function DUF1828 [Puniceibacterium sp. IMCC21224]